MTVAFHRLAEQELFEAVEHYEGQANGLGAEFLQVVEEGCELLIRHPKAARIVTADARRLVLKRFPYNLVYSFVDGELRILAVAHQTRSPSYWLRRS